MCIALSARLGTLPLLLLTTPRRPARLQITQVPEELPYDDLL